MLKRYRDKHNKLVRLEVAGCSIVIFDAITNDECYRKTVHWKFLPYVEELGSKIVDLILNPDVLMVHSYINNTKFTITNDQYNPSFFFPKYVQELILCCYIVAHRLGATLEEIGFSNGQGYQVRFVGVGSWGV